ncbi:GIY-YIG nuclease family protein [Spiroplasma endosymbiont of Nebria brevicollis]|uniref:GIY-YIG nuclease family protein n=1 Tax=Spiroplasma endosymbiont of Nebria brevicollis TaxID=3066284 RepID=UPI00313F33B9
MNKVKNKEIKVINSSHEGWIDLKNVSILSYPNVTNKKGVYIIWNKTKDKHYVGQSKNMSRRLLQHFKNGDVKNIIFAKDWYNGDYFCYKYHFCETKDELDSLEKRYIDEYVAFERGYNSTNGNI